jgi:hypothetical protein
MLDVARGYTNKEIGERLHISVKTVEGHKSSIMDKLGFNRAPNSCATPCARAGCATSEGETNNLVNRVNFLQRNALNEQSCECRRDHYKVAKRYEHLLAMSHMAQTRSVASYTLFVMLL